MNRARLGEMADVDARRERVDVVGQRALGLVQAVAAGEDDIGEAEQLLLERQQPGRRVLEIRQFVHAVVDGRRGLQMTRERQHHRRVIPAQQRSALRHQHIVEQAFQHRLICRPVGIVGQLRHDHDHSGVRTHPGHEARRGGVAIFGLFPHHDVPVAREPRHQMLRALRHEIPAQMRKAQQCLARLRHSHGVRFEHRRANSLKRLADWIVRSRSQNGRLR